MELKEYFLNPGELIFSKKPIIVKTVLGSCVAVVIHDKINKFGGMCHYLLPDSTNGERKSTKYGDVAIKLLIDKFLEAGSNTANLEASIIGGAFIIFDEREIFFIGDRNADMADKILRENNIRIKSVNTGGEQGRKVLYNTGTNQLIVETIKSITIDDLYRSNI